MPFATSVKDAILNWYKGTTFTAAPASVYVALLTTNPSDDAGTGLVEVVNGAGASQWNGYARQAATFGAISGTGTRQVANSGVVDFGNASISSGTITLTGFALYSASIAGTFLGWASFSSQTITTGTDVQFGAGNLTLSES